MKVSQSDIELETVVSRIRKGEWDLQPDFQRGEVWDTKRRVRLIDTILRGWYVPAVHIVVEPDGSELVLDGQQRLVTIRDFFTDQFPVDGTIEPDSSANAAVNGQTYSELPEATRRAINRFPMTVVKLTEFDAAEPNELFFRLNQASALTPSEKRNALHGPARNQVRELVDRLRARGLLAPERIGFSNGRLAYDDIIARACVVVEMDTSRRHVNNTVVEDFYRNSRFSNHTLVAVEAAGNSLLEQVLHTSGQKVRFNKGTLQTWLLYCYWATMLAPLPAALLSTFETARTALRRGTDEVAGLEASGLASVIRLYDDRASYRVTDVSSVLIRDLAIHLFAERLFDMPSHLGSNRLLETVATSPDSAGSLIADYLDASRWGEPLAPGGTK